LDVPVIADDSLLLYSLSKKLFIGRLNDRATRADVEEFLGRFGTVDFVALKRGYAFARMSNDDEAQKAIDSAKDASICGFPVSLEYAKSDKYAHSGDKVAPSKVLYVQGAGGEKEDDVRNHFDKYGGLVKVACRGGYALIEFESIESAISAHDAADGSRLNRSTLDVSYSFGHRYGIKPPRPDGGGRRDRGGRRGGYRRDSPYGDRGRGGGRYDGSRRGYDDYDDRGRRSPPRYRRDDYDRRKSPPSRYNDRRHDDYDRRRSPPARSDYRRNDRGYDDRRSDRGRY